MSEINANIVVEPFDLTVTQTNNQITITPTALDLNIFTAAAIAGGGINDVQYNMGGTLGGIPTANYIAGNFNLGSTNTVKLLGGANAYFLQTDGTGNLTWAPGTANVSGNGTSAGANNEIQLTNGSGNFKAKPGFTFDTGINLFTVPGNAYVSGNINSNTNIIANGNITSNTNIIANGNITSNTNIIANGNVQGTYLLGNGYYITGIDPSQISNANTNVKVYANTITFSENGNANVVTIGPNQQMTVTTMNVNSLANFFGAVGFNAPVAMNSNLSVGGQFLVRYIVNGAQNIELTAPGFNVFSNTTTFTGNVIANRFSGNGYLLTNINASNVSGQVANALVANTVINGYQPNITSLGNLTFLTINDGSSSNTNFNFSPIGINLNTAIGTLPYVQIANLGNTSNKTNTAVVFGDQGTNNYAATNDVYANIGGNKLYVGSQFFNLYGGNTTDKAAQSIYVWNVFDTNSDIANATVSTGTSLQVGSGVSIVRGAPLNDSGVLASFSYGGNTDPTNSVGYRMTRRRGNGAARLSLQPNDYLGNIEWRGAQANGALPTGNRFAKIGAKVDSTYVANTAAQPVGLEFVVVNTTANITHSFYSNGDINFAGNVNASYFIGNGSQLTGLPDSTGLSNGNSNIKILANANITFSSAGNANIVVVTGTGVNIAGTLNATGVITGNGSGLTNVTGANITGTVANANYATNAGNANTANSATTAGTVTTAAQPNITSLGNLSTLTVTGNTISNNFIGRLANGNSNISIQSNGSIILSATGSNNVVNVTSNGLEIGIGKFCNVLGIANINTANISLANINTANISLANINTLISNSLTLTSLTVDNLNATSNRIHLGNGAGGFGANMNNDSIVIGNLAGRGANCLESVYIGYNAGSNNAGTRSIAIGYQAALANQGQRAIAIGGFAGGGNQGANTIAIGYYSGQLGQLDNAIAIGSNAGQSAQQSSAIALGQLAGQQNQNSYSIAIGYKAGQNTQGLFDGNNIAIGYQAGLANQYYNTIAIGKNAANADQHDHSIAIGINAASNTQSYYSVAIGTNAGANNQGANSIAIGTNAGYPNAQANNSIVLNASGANLNAPTANALFVKPIRNVTGDPGFTVALYYNPTTGEIGYK